MRSRASRTSSKRSPPAKGTTWTTSRSRGANRYLSTTHNRHLRARPHTRLRASSLLSRPVHLAFAALVVQPRHGRPSSLLTRAERARRRTAAGSRSQSTKGSALVLCLKVSNRRLDPGLRAALASRRAQPDSSSPASAIWVAARLARLLLRLALDFQQACTPSLPTHASPGVARLPRPTTSPTSRLTPTIPVAAFPGADSPADTPAANS
ncbi:hypothetical protein AAT19DRAFT_12675 [Rhodotorula toruloides]|uniref:Uncharacterized protein n=1 Tax=Rhodotorula toruloides TaxID=5286 RepID=A0A2T0AGW9_RHOTO|nr:hypothetical protein AAT19DRAFT_12675 [Rhodotorula toruloides]